MNPTVTHGPTTGSQGIINDISAPATFRHVLHLHAQYRVLNMYPYAYHQHINQQHPCHCLGSGTLLEYVWVKDPDQVILRPPEL